MPDAAALARVHERLRERDVEVTPVDHGISEALYFENPDGNGVEIHRDTRKTTGRDELHGRNERLDPADV